MGDILVFLTGQDDIDAAVQLLNEDAQNHGRHSSGWFPIRLSCTLICSCGIGLDSPYVGSLRVTNMVPDFTLYVYQSGWKCQSDPESSDQVWVVLASGSTFGLVGSV